MKLSSKQAQKMLQALRDTLFLDDKAFTLSPENRIKLYLEIINQQSEELIDLDLNPIPSATKD